MLSIHHRGSKQNPGLVLALDQAQDKTCTGLALKVSEADSEAVLQELRDRELVSSAYLEEHVTLNFADGKQQRALAYVIDRTNVQYCNFPLEEQAQRIARATGGRGPNDEYLWKTADLLAELDVRDPDMEWLAMRVRQLNTGIA
jgi:cation transport protein ChaC